MGKELTGHTTLKGLGITDGDSIKLHGASEMEAQDPAQEQKNKKVVDELLDDGKDYENPTEGAKQEGNQNYFETERSEEI